MTGSATDPAESGQNGQDPAGYDLIRPDLTGSGGVLSESGQICWLESGNGDQMLSDSGDSWIFSFRNFFVQSKRQQIFLRKLFFFEIDFVKNILQWKSFYVETNGALIMSDAISLILLLN
jgi:hypothetical protein